MSFRYFPQLAAAIALLPFCSTPALASGADYAQPGWQGPAPATAATTMPVSREAWLAECRHRATPIETKDDYGWGRHRRDRQRNAEDAAMQRCQAYLADYEGWVSTVRAGYAAQQLSVTPVNPCCRSNCSQAVEYIDEYAPVRRPVRHLDKRIRVAPDKRVRIQ